MGNKVKIFADIAEFFVQYVENMEGFRGRRKILSIKGQTWPPALSDYHCRRRTGALNPNRLACFKRN